MNISRSRRLKRPRGALRISHKLFYQPWFPIRMSDAPNAMSFPPLRVCWEFRSLFRWKIVAFGVLKFDEWDFTSLDFAIWMVEFGSTPYPFFTRGIRCRYYYVKKCMVIIKKYHFLKFNNYNCILACTEFYHFGIKNTCFFHIVLKWKNNIKKDQFFFFETFYLKKKVWVFIIKMY